MDYKKRLQTKLKQPRYQHSIGVAETAKKLAAIYGYSTKKAEAAGLLHDCAKYMPSDIILENCKKYHIPFTDSEEKNPHLLHAKLGEFYAKTKYRVRHKDILKSIRNHTTGRPGMSLLEKIIFVADYIEPGRKYSEELERIREISLTNLDLAVFLILENTIKYIKSWNGDIDQPTLDAYNYYKKRIKEENIDY